jgi:hypothetical protein
MNATHPWRHEKRKAPRGTPAERFWRFVDKRGPDECWQWTGGKTPFGHGRFRLSRADGQAGSHRFSFELHYGPLPKGLLVLHHCDKPGCVNPRHLFAGTQSDNLRDCRDKKRLRGHFQDGPDSRRRNGSAHPNSKLSEADATAIKYDDRPHRIIAIEYGIDRSVVGLIKRGKAWKHV